MKKDTPMVSVCMITYNQEKYIKQALESVLNQICDFEFEVLVSNDASTDDSNKIINTVILNHINSKKVKYINQKENLGINSNLKFVYEKCNGKYVAVCEGDDYWTDPFKLQKQVNFLENNLEFSICYHPVDVLFKDGEFIEDFGVKGLINKSESNIFDLLILGNYIHTPSVVFRNIFIHLPINFLKSPLGDFFLWVLLAKHGDIKRLEDNMAVYRYGVGVLSSKYKEISDIVFFQTLTLLKDEVVDEALKRIIELRKRDILFAKLPKSITENDIFEGINKSQNLIKFVTFKELTKAIFQKI